MASETLGDAQSYGVTKKELEYAPPAIPGVKGTGRSGQRTRIGLASGSYVHPKGERPGIQDENSGDTLARARAYDRSRDGRTHRAAH